MSGLLETLLAAAAIAALLGTVIRVPGGGRIPLSTAVVLAAAALLGPLEALAAAALALLLAAVLQRARRSVWRGDLVARAPEVAGAIGGAALAPTEHQLVAVAAGTLAIVTARFALAPWVRGVPEAPDPRAALPIDLTLGCGAALLVETTTNIGLGMALVSLLPLLVVRFAFDRYADAAATLAETVEALGLVPELAGAVPLGHSERTARYAEAVAVAAGCDRREVRRVIAAARLHHLGAVADADRPPEGEVAAAGARILREGGFPADVADLVARTGAEAADDLPASVVQAASAFDDVVGDDDAEDRVEQALGLVGLRMTGRSGRQATAALLNVVADRPELVREVITAGNRFRDAAEGLDLAAILGSDDAELLPLVRRLAPRVTPPPGSRPYAPSDGA
jgi:hypothetical protein